MGASSLEMGLLESAMGMGAWALEQVIRSSESSHIEGTVNDSHLAHADP